MGEGTADYGRKLAGEEVQEIMTKKTESVITWIAALVGSVLLSAVMAPVTGEGYTSGIIVGFLAVGQMTRRRLWPFDS